MSAPEVSQLPPRRHPVQQLYECWLRLKYSVSSIAWHSGNRLCNSFCGIIGCPWFLLWWVANDPVLLLFWFGLSKHFQYIAAPLDLASELHTIFVFFCLPCSVLRCTGRVPVTLYVVGKWDVLVDRGSRHTRAVPGIMLVGLCQVKHGCTGSLSNRCQGFKHIAKGLNYILWDPQAVPGTL